MKHTHYAVAMDWASEYETGSSIVGIKHTIDEALKLFNETVEEERELAIENEWTIYDDLDDRFDAGKEGYYAASHVVIYIQIVE